MVSEEDEYYVQEDIPVIDKGVYIRIDEIDTEDDYVYISTDGVGPSGMDIPLERIETWLDEGKLIEKERDSQMHD